MAPPKGGSSVKIPDRFGAPHKAAEAALRKAAEAAAAEVQKAKKNPEEVMEALAGFHDAWLDSEAWDAMDAVQGFFVKLADQSGADLEPMDAWEEIHLGLYGMEGIGADELVETIAELQDCATGEAEEQLGAFADAITDGLMRNGRAFLPGFGTFTVDDLAELDEPGAYDVQVALEFDPAFEKRLLRAHSGEESEEAEEGAPHGGVIEALTEAFLNEWAVDIEGLGTVACQWEEDGPAVVFKAAVDLREELLENAGGEEEPPEEPVDDR
jgi:hypothetical protein